MANNRQKTLFETWNKPTGRGAGSNLQRQPQGSGFGQLGIGNNVGRGRGQMNRKTNPRGGKSAKETSRGSKSSFTDDTIVIDDDDEICQQAMGQFELSTNDISKGIDSINSETNLPGFDETAGSIWIYPTNSKVRDYQFDIVQTALFHNTLVSLPTGLGKTFIAAVVMYNFHRWYPNDLIIFMAPTRPLVTQQLEACHNIVGILPSQTVELTGHIAPKKRDELWKSKTVFFLTPQVMTSDLNRGACPVNKVRCIVVDEAHKAMGNHAYVQVISKVSEQQNPLFFRVLALSATPGSDILAVQQVFKNLLISRVEIRSEDSPDILPYSHHKTTEKIVVDLPPFMVSCRDSLQEVFQIYTGKLMKLNILFGRDGFSFTQFQLLKARESFRNHPPMGIPNYQKGYIESDFATCISLAHALELLNIHGLRSCYFFLQGICEKERGYAVVSAELRRNVPLRNLLNEIQEKLNISLQNSTLNLSSSALFTTFSSHDDSSHFVPEEGKETDYTLSHPKMAALKDIVVKHFESFLGKGETTRVMIFSQYRDSVQEIGAMLSTLGSLVKPMVFIGQAKSGAGGAGLNQKRQGEVLQKFRTGGYNVLVATSVGEEGLNIGEVDLIICYDASKSPTRLVQRMGRTGRQRQGKTVFLLTRGKEEKTYSSSISMQNSISKNITDLSRLQSYLYQSSPRMVPVGVDPTCFKMNVVLSSEREDYNTKESGFVKPSKPAKKAAVKPTASSSSATTSNIEKFCKKIPSSKNKLKIGNSSKENNENVKEVEPLPEVIEIDMENDFDHFEHQQAHHDQDYIRFLQDFYGLEDERSQSFSACLYIPTPPDFPNMENNSNNKLSRSDDLLLDDFDVNFLRQKMETTFRINSGIGKCACGNSNSNCDVNSSSSAGLPSNSRSNSTCSENDPVIKSPSTFPVKLNSVFGRQKFENTLAIKEKDENANISENNADLGFIFGDDDPFFDDDDDWMNEIDNFETKCNSPSVSMEKVNHIEENKQIVEPCLKKDKDKTAGDSKVANSPVLEENFEMEVENNVVSGSENSKEVRFTRTKLLELFQDDEILFEEEGDYTDSDNISTTSNEDFGTPVRQNGEVEKLEDSPFKVSNIQTKRVECKPDNSKSSFPQSYIKDSRQLGKTLFDDKRSGNSKVNVNLFEDKPSRQSTPKKSKEEKFPDIEIVDIEDEFSSSPDLSQYRIENRIKRAKLDPNCALGSYPRMTAPDNNSADILNGYLEQMRLKNSNGENTLDNQKNRSSIVTFKQTPEYSTKSLVSESNLNLTNLNQTSVNTGDDSKPKKKFVFKKRSSSAGVSPEVLNQTVQFEKPLTPVSKPNLNFKNQETSLQTRRELQFGNLNDVSKLNEPKSIPSAPKSIMKSPDAIPKTSPPKKSWGLSRNKRTENVPKSKNVKFQEKIDCSKNINNKGENSIDEIKSIKQDVRKYREQYCSEDVVDLDFLDDTLGRTEFKPLPNQNFIDKTINTNSKSSTLKDLIEQKRLKALEIRNKKRAEEQHHLKEIQATHFKIPQINSSLYPESKKLPSKPNSVLYSSSPVINNGQENSHKSPIFKKFDIPSSTSAYIGVISPIQPSLSPIAKRSNTSSASGYRRFMSPTQVSESLMSKKVDSTVTASGNKKFKFKSPTQVSESPSVKKMDSSTTSTSRYRKFKSPTQGTILDFSDDDDFDLKPQCKAQKSSIPSTKSHNTTVTEPSDDDGFTPPRPRPIFRTKPRRPKNPFLEYEAEVSGDSSDENDDDLDELDEFDESFVTQHMDDTVTATQQVRYFQSVKDLLPNGRLRSPTSPKITAEMLNLNYGEEYDDEGDSFCVANDEVEYADIGAFTQAMQKAKVDLENGDSGNKKRVTRNGRRHMNNNVSEKCANKKRKRVFTLKDSSEED